MESVGFEHRSLTHIFPAIWWVCGYHIQISSYKYIVAPKYSSAGIEDKAVWRTSQDSLTAALPATWAGHRLQLSLHVKWVPSPLSLLLCRGKYKMSRQASFIIHWWIKRPASNDITFAGERKNQNKKLTVSLLFLVQDKQREQKVQYVIARSALVIDAFVFKVSNHFPFGKYGYRSIKNHKRCLSVGKDKHTI